MAKAKTGDTVQVHYTGKLEDGTVFDTSREREPLEFTVGSGQVIPGFEEAVEGMEPQEKKTVTIVADKAYGPHREEMIIDVPKQQFPPDLDPQQGQFLEIKQPDEQTAVVRVADIKDESVTLDGNHPLAGKDLTFEIELEKIA